MPTIIPAKEIHIQPTKQAPQCNGADNYDTIRKDPRSLNERIRDLPQDTDRARLKHQRKWEFHGIPKPPLRESTKQMSMRNKQHVTGVFPVHVVFVQGPNLVNQTINAGRHLFRRPVSKVVNIQKGNLLNLQERPNWTGQDRTHSPLSHPSLQISHPLSRSRPCSFLSARISLVKSPSYNP